MPKPQPACHNAEGLAEVHEMVRGVAQAMFRRLSETVYVSPQIDVADIAEAGRLGITMVINNRPEDESPDQTPGAVIAAAANGESAVGGETSDSTA